MKQLQKDGEILNKIWSLLCMTGLSKEGLSVKLFAQIYHLKVLIRGG